MSIYWKILKAKKIVKVSLTSVKAEKFQKFYMISLVQGVVAVDLITDIKSRKAVQTKHSC